MKNIRLRYKSEEDSYVFKLKDEDGQYEAPEVSTLNKYFSYF